MTANIRQTQIVSVGSSIASFIMLWIPLAILIGIFVLVGVNGQQDAWAIVAILGAIGIVGSTILIRKRISLLDDSVEYRGLLRTIRIPVATIRSIKAISSGRDNARIAKKGPGFFMIIDSSIDQDPDQLHISIKTFQNLELRRFLEEARSREIPVYINDVVASILKI